MSGVKAMILAGGQGTRFWPVSRKSYPKQFLSICDSGQSLIQVTQKRMVPLVGADNIWVITNTNHQDLIQDHLPGIKMICEPKAMNTAPAMGLAAVYAAKEDPDTVMIVLPADHAVENEKALRSNLSRAVDYAQKADMLVTLGIKPENPNTAYGYIEEGEKIEDRVCHIKCFHEKPDQDKANKYYKDGAFYWNSGMFVWKARVLLDAMKEHMPETYKYLMEISEAIGTEKEEEVLAEIFPKTERISIDFGVMEKVENKVMVEAEPYGWNDVGSWDAWGEHFENDAEANVSIGETQLIDSSGNLVFNKDKYTALIGCEDLIVINTDDALLICHKDRAQDVKAIVQKLKKDNREELL